MGWSLLAPAFLLSSTAGLQASTAADTALPLVAQASTTPVQTPATQQRPLGQQLPSRLQRPLGTIEPGAAQESLQNHRLGGVDNVHPQDLEGMGEAEQLRRIPGIEGTRVDPQGRPGQADRQRLPGQQRQLGDGPGLESQGYQPPKGIPPSPVPDRSGQQPRRVLGPPSASLRNAGSGIAGKQIKEGTQTTPEGGTAETRKTEAGVYVTVTTNSSGTVTTVERHTLPDRGQRTTQTTSWELDNSGTVTSVTETITETSTGRILSSGPSWPADPLDQQLVFYFIDDFTRSHTQDTYGGSGSGINPITRQRTDKPKEHPDQVNPGPDGAPVHPAGARLRPTDLEVNPDPQRSGQPFSPGDSMRRIQQRPEPGPRPGDTPGQGVP